MPKQLCDYFEEIAELYDIEMCCEYHCHYATLKKRFFFYYDSYLYTKMCKPVIMLPTESPHICLRNTPFGDYLKIMLMKDNIFPSNDILDILMLLRILHLYRQFTELISSTPKWDENWAAPYNDYFKRTENRLIPQELIMPEFFNMPFENKALNWSLEHTVKTYRYVMYLISQGEK